MKEFVDVFKALSDGTRLRIMWLLAKAKSELCVCEIVDALEQSQHNVSRHLKVLKAAGLVGERKEGRWVYYSLTHSNTRFAAMTMEAIRALPRKELLQDEQKLRWRLSLREKCKCVVGIRSGRYSEVARQKQCR